MSTYAGLSTMVILLLLSACGTDQIQPPRYRLPEKSYGNYAEYVTDYMEFAKLYGVDKRTYIKQFTTISVAEGLANPDKPDVAAYCQWRTQIWKNRTDVIQTWVVISHDFANHYANTRLMRWTLFHELGHCLHGLPHIDNPLEIMNPILPESWELYDDDNKLPSAINRMFAKIRDDAI